MMGGFRYMLRFDSMCCRLFNKSPVLADTLLNDNRKSNSNDNFIYLLGGNLWMFYAHHIPSI